MGGVVEGGIGITDKTSPRRVAIEKVQAELRQEYDFREKRKRELEFLENGGDPLEYFKDRNAFSVSVQSTSFTDQHPDQFVCEAKGSFALTASPHGDSVESSGRLGANPCEPNCADNLMLFDAENTFSEGDKNSLHPRRSDVVPSEKLCQGVGMQRTREHGDSAAFCPPKKAYRRRNRSRPNRDGTRSSSTNVNRTCGSHGSSLPSVPDPAEVKELVSDAENQNMPLNFNSKSTTPADDTLQNSGLVENKQDLDLTGGKAIESTKDHIEGVPMDTAPDSIAPEAVVDDKCSHKLPSGSVRGPVQVDSDVPVGMENMKEMNSSIIYCQPDVSAVKADNLSSSFHMNGFSSKKVEELKNDAPNTGALRGIKGLDSALSCTLNSFGIDVNNDSEMCTKVGNADSNGKISQKLVSDGTPVVEGVENVEEKKEIEVFDSSTLVNLESSFACQSQGENGYKNLPKEKLSQSESALKDEVEHQFVSKAMEVSEPTGSESGRRTSEMFRDNHGPQNENSSSVRHQASIDISPEFNNVGAGSSVAQTSSMHDSKLATKIDEDSILKEAQIIEAKRKRIMELSVATSPKQTRPKSHWDYVIEEIAWLADDFAQERVWKIAAAAQICSRAAFSCRLRLQDISSGMVTKKAAHKLAKSVLEFWQSAEETSTVFEQKSQKDGARSLQAYAMRFLKYNNSSIVHTGTEVPSTPDQLIDVGLTDRSWEDNLTEENLFYTVPLGAMEAYKSSIESHVSQCEKIGSSLQEEVETSVCNVIGEDFESQDNAYDEDEGETNAYDMSTAFKSSKSSRFGPRKRKHLTHAYGVRSYEVGSDIMAMPYAENKFLTHHSAVPIKRPGGSLNVSIPTKRVRTASRRIISPFNAGTSGCIQVPIKTDASSGDTNSYQDDQSTPFGGSLVPSSLEVESVRDFERQFPYDSAEVSTKHKRKKKAKHLNAAYEQQWQVDSSFQNEQFQRDHLRKFHQLDSNGSSGLLTQPVVKRPKTMRQSHDNSFENITPVSGPAPSPAASQMSNMSTNPNKLIKIFGGRDRGRKPKVLKVAAGQPGTGSPWTLFEDQALVVLAHDLGPNWELVSDALNSSMQFKCTFRKAKECKERHNRLMDRTSADGADSAEDSGSSQPYPSTLPGIPKGSARQLFQRLQEPMEEETIKSHFEKIIIIRQKQNYRKTQNDNQDPKQIQQPHSSHTTALSQARQNNLNGGPILTPLDLCDATDTGLDRHPPGYQAQHSGGLTNSNQATATPMLPASSASSVLQGSPNMTLGNNVSTSLGTANTSVRDGRYGVTRSTSLSADEHQRMHQYNQMMSSRNMQQISAPGALPGTDRGVRLLPGGSGMGLVCGVNRSMPMVRTGFQGAGSSSVVSSGNMVSPGMASANMNSGVGSGQGNSMLRPREALNVMQPGLSQDSPQQMMVPDLQMQVSPRNSQGMSHFRGLSSQFPNQVPPPSVPSYPPHHQTPHPASPQQPQVLSSHDPHFQVPGNHGPNPQQQSYAIRLPKERQQHRFLQQQQAQQQMQQPQFSTSSSTMPHVQSQSPLQNISQGQPQTSSMPVSLSPLAPATSMHAMPQHQQKHQAPSQGAVRNAQAGGSGLASQTSKQRQRQQQQFSQANRQHPQQRQQHQGQQSSKVAKGTGRGNLVMHQNFSINPAVENGVSTIPGNQCLEKDEGASQLIPSEGLYTGSTLVAAQSTKQYVSSQSSNQSLPQQKIYSGQAASSAKHTHQLTSHSDSSSRNHVPAGTPGLSAGHQSVSPLPMAGSNHQQLPPSQQKPVNPNHLALQRATQPNRPANSDSMSKPQVRDSDTGHQPSSSLTEMGKVATLHAVTNSTANVVPGSATSAHQWHASDPMLDPHASVPSNAGESTPVSQGPGQRLLAASLTSVKHDSDAQWQQIHQPNSPVPQPQRQQPMQALHSQQQTQLLQAGNDKLYGVAGDHRSE